MISSIKEIRSTDIGLPLVLTVDSHGLYSTITTLPEENYYRLRQTVSRLRDSFERKEIYVMQWVAGKQNNADALTKQNPVMFRTLKNVCANRIQPPEILARSERVLSSSTV